MYIYNINSRDHKYLEEPHIFSEPILILMISITSRFRIHKMCTRWLIAIYISNLFNVLIDGTESCRKLMYLYCNDYTWLSTIKS